MSRLSPPVRTRPGGRSEQVRIQVARACLELLAEGDATLGPVEVARRAGVSRATLHRWWPTKDDLLREALGLHTSTLHVADTGAWSVDVRVLAHQLARFFADPLEVAQNRLMASGVHGDFSTAVLRHYEAIFAAWRGLVTGAQARGEVRADVDADVVYLLLGSPLVLTPLLFGLPLTADDVDAVVDLVLRATAP